MDGEKNEEYKGELIPPTANTTRRQEYSLSSRDKRYHIILATQDMG